jgi:hypothetical protein
MPQKQGDYAYDPTPLPREHNVDILVSSDNPPGFTAECWYDMWRGTYCVDRTTAEREAAEHRASPVGEPSPDSPYASQWQRLT